MGSATQTNPGFQAAQLAVAEVCNSSSGRKYMFLSSDSVEYADYKDYDFERGLPGLRIKISSKHF